MNQDQFTPQAGTAGSTGEYAQAADGIAARAQHYAEDTLHAARVRADDALERGQDYVRANPVPVVLGALAVGVLIGIAIGHREEPTFRERYVDDPLQNARDALASILSPLASRARSEYSHARSAAVDAGDHVHDGYLDPVFKRARRAADKLKFW